jgi:branched-chain amino acid transport system permease protein
MVSVKLMAMVVIGGSASLWGALLGTALLVSLPELLTRLQDYEMLVYGAILILVMMFAPKGLAGIVSIVFSRSRMRKEDAQAL